MATKIVTKNSSTASAVPTASDLVQGELAVNVADKRLFTEDNAGAIVELGTNPSGNVTFQDNGKAIFGASGDLQIYHDGSNSYIKDLGTGDLLLSGNAGVQIQSDAGENMITTAANGAVSLFYDASAKLATTSTGIDVTGTVTADGLTVDGAAAIGANATKVNFYSDSTYSGIYNGSSLTSDESIYMGGDSMFFYAAGKKRLDINSGGDISFYEDTGTTESLIWDSSLTQLKVIGRETSRGGGVYAFDVDNSAHSSNLTLAGAMRVKGFYGDSFIVNGLGDVSFFDDSGTAKFFWDASAERLGIGTDSPTAKLTLNDAGQQVGIDFKEAGTTRAHIEYDGAIPALELGTNGAANVVLKTSNTERMRIDANGKIFMNEGVPFAWTDGSLNVSADIYGDSSDNLVFRNTSAKTERMRIDSSGNVGIGQAPSTFSNWRILELKGDTAGAMLNFENSASTRVSTLAYDDAVDSLRIQNFLANPITFETSNTERMRIDSSGNLLVGTTSYNDNVAGIGLSADNYFYVARQLDVANQSRVVTFNRKGADGSILDFAKDGTTVGSIGVEGSDLTIGTGDTGLQFRDASDAIRPFNIGTNAARDASIDLGRSSERFRDLYLSGNCNASRVFTDKDGDWGMEMRGATSARIRFHTSAGGSGQVGAITVSTSATTYATSSDYRLKENVVAMTGATERLKQLNPSRFNFIADADTTVDGFLAHEVQDIVPEAITGTKDAMRDEEYEVTPAVLDDEGNVVTESVTGTRSVPDYQGIDQSKLVPLLVATIQELEARITQLENN